MKGRKESDHNTITMETKCQTRKALEKRQIWRTNNEEAWEDFNKEMQDTPEEVTKDFNKFEKFLNKTMAQQLGKITITPGKKRKITNPEIKRLRQHKKQAKKDMEKAHKEGNRQGEPLKKYLEYQQKLREKIEEQEGRNIEKIAQEIISRGGTNSQQFWKIRKSITKQNSCDYELITEDGIKVIDPSEHKEHVAKYYEELYTAREGNPQYKKWTNHIKRIVASVDAILQDAPNEEPFTGKELDKAIKTLRRGKCPGPDNIPNEAFIKASANTRKVYLKMFNHILEKGNIPEQWLNGNITRLYKGKGTKGKCSNERGITLASNVGKLFERMVNNRATTKAQMTDAQAGGKKGRATVDHLLAFKEAVNAARSQKLPFYATFLDVTKAYDKAWIDAILYVMYKRGVNSKLWQIIKKLNENLTANIHTKYGPTRKITIKDSIRQGGVLSVLQYALLMDEINKEIQETEKYHIKFGKEKSQSLTIGKTSEQPRLTLGQMQVEPTEKYKYLGEMVNEKLNLKDQLKQIEGKVEAAYQAMLVIAGDCHFKNIHMETFWKLVSACIIPIITYAGETRKPNKEENKKLNQLLDRIIRRILMVPESTPREALYIESGLLDIETITDKNRIMMGERIKKNGNQLLNEVTKNAVPGGWKELLRKTKEKYDVTDEDLQKSKYTTRKDINKKITAAFKRNTERNGENKSKINYLLEGTERWTPGQPKSYMLHLGRTQASTIFKARTRMLHVKNNYKNAYKNQACSACQKEAETQEHVLAACPAIHKDNTTTVEKYEIFVENHKEVAKTAKKIAAVIEKLEKLPIV